MNANKKKTLAIIGGSGPEAGINVMENILSIHRTNTGNSYKSDKDSVSIIMVQDPGVGGPHGTWDLEDPNSAESVLLWKNMTDIIMKLHVINIDYFCIACNTLHYLERRLREWMKANRIKPIFISIVEVTKSVIINHYKENVRSYSNGTRDILIDHNHSQDLLSCYDNGLQRNRVAILGSRLTTDINGMSPYAGLFNDDNVVLDCFTLQNEHRDLLQKFIDETKKDGVTSHYQTAFSKFLKQQFLTESGKQTDYIVLSCTELPILLANDCRLALEKAGIVVIDPNLVLANAMLRQGGYLESLI